MTDRTTPRPSHPAGPKWRPWRRVAAVVGALGLGLACSLPAGTASAALVAAPYDFNGDGHADLAVGVPGESLGAVTAAGAVQVIYGASGGLESRGSKLWTQDSPGVKGKAGLRDAFGRTHASADFDRDGYADLAVGIPGSGHGSVAVLYGSRSGLTARDQLFYPSDLDLPDVWGGSLTTGDFDGDGRADLAIGSDPASPSVVEDAKGAITVLRGTSRGLTVTGAVRLTKDSPGVAGTSEPGDAFGLRLAAGDVTRDGRDDLVAATRQRIGTGGGFYLLRGSAAGLTGVGSQFFDAKTPGLAPAGTRFADLNNDVALADFDGDGHADLAVGDANAGPPGSTTCSDNGACPGAVLVLRGTSKGLSVTTGKQLWYQDRPGVPGTSEPGDAFGTSMATGDLNGDGHPDLAIGVPGESNGSTTVYGVGAVNVLYGSAGGLVSRGAQRWSQGSPRIKSAPALTELFGSELRIADYGLGRSGDLAVASPGTRSGTAEYTGAVNVLYGSTHGVTAADDYWTQSSPGITGTPEASDFFGALGG